MNKLASTWLVTAALATGHVFAGELTALSYRADLPVGSTANPLIAGVVVSGGAGSRDLVVRAIGPGLQPFGVSNFEPDPSFTIFTHPGSINSGGNNDWSASLAPVFASVGLFSLGSGSKDAALVFPATGVHTVHVSGTSSSHRNVLVEVYDKDPGTTGKKLQALSVRNSVDEGTTAIVGFVVSGSTGTEVLIRAIGPGLASVGVSTPMPDPILRLHNSAGQLIAENNDWGGGLGASSALNASGQLGASPAPQTKDAMLLVYLRPGAYTASVSHGTSGVGANKTVLLEIYKGQNYDLVFDQNYWGTGHSYLQLSNNCYNYATNIRFNPLPNQPSPVAQIGRAGGVPLTSGLFTEQQIRASVQADGLIPTTALAVAPAGWIKVALFRTEPWPDGRSIDFHFYRQDSNGRWSHKNGGDLASNKGANNVEILNPEDQNSRPSHITDLVGYYWVPPGTTVAPFSP